MNINKRLQNIKAVIKYVLGTLALLTACYGFWGSLFPDLTLVRGTYRIYQENTSAFDDFAAEGYAAEVDGQQLYEDMLQGRIKVTCRSWLWDFLEQKYGWNNE